VAKRKAKPEAHSVPANPKNWSKESKRSCASEYTKKYEDIAYECARCGKPATFTAEEQQYAYEVEKRYFWQRRKLCAECWQEANAIKAEIKQHEEKWAMSKDALKNDAAFLDEWLRLLVRLEEYHPYKADSAKKNMLRKLLERNA
jgi:hypothetical protein